MKFMLKVSEFQTNCIYSLWVTLKYNFVELMISQYKAHIKYVSINIVIVKHIGNIL